MTLISKCCGKKAIICICGEYACPLDKGGCNNHCEVVEEPCTHDKDYFCNKCATIISQEPQRNFEPVYVKGCKWCDEHTTQPPTESWEGELKEIIGHALVKQTPEAESRCYRESIDLVNSLLSQAEARHEREVQVIRMAHRETVRQIVADQGVCNCPKNLKPKI